MQTADENMEEWHTSSAVEQETIRAVVLAYAAGKIELATPKRTDKKHLRYAPHFTRGMTCEEGSEVRPYTDQTVADFLGWTYPNGQPSHRIRNALHVLEAAEELDAQAIARELYEQNPKINLAIIGLCLGRPQQRISEWLRDLTDRQKQQREWDLEILRRLGWTQREMGDALGLSRPRVSERLSALPDSVKPTKTQLAKTHQIEDVAQTYNMPLQLAHALDLDPIREDGDRAKQLGVTIRPHDAWMFSGFRDLFGHGSRESRPQGGNPRGVSSMLNVPPPGNFPRKNSDPTNRGKAVRYVVIGEAVVEFSVRACHAQDAAAAYRDWLRAHPRLRRGPLRVQLVDRRVQIVLDANGFRCLPPDSEPG